MSTIIDSLFVELGFDTTKLTSGQKKAVDELRKVEKAAEQSAKHVNRQSDKMSEGFALLQGRLLAIAGLFLGGMGITEFTRHITNLTSQTGYLARSLGVSAQQLGQWQGAAASVGAGAGEVGASFAAIQRSMANFQLTGQSQLNAFSYATHQAGQGPAVDLYNSRGQWRSPTDILMSMSRWAVAQPNRAVASEMLARTGMSQGMINLLLLGPKELEARLRLYQHYAPTQDQVQKFQQLQQAFAKASAASLKLGRDLEAMVAPKVVQFFNNLAKSIGTLDDWATGHLKRSDFQSKHDYDVYKSQHNPADHRSVWQKYKDHFKSWWYGKSYYDGKPGSAPHSSLPPHASPSSYEPASRGGWWTPDRKEHAVQYLVAHGDLPEISARALVARWSGVESTRRGPWSVNSFSGAQGIGQWLGSRQFGYKMGDADSQYAHVIYELKHRERRAYDTLMRAKTAREAAIGASQYERAEGWNGYSDAYVGQTMRAMRVVPSTNPDLWTRGTAPILMPHVGAAGTVSNSSHVTTGDVHVHTQATDARGIARDIRSELTRFDRVANANTGLV